MRPYPTQLSDIQVSSRWSWFVTADSKHPHETGAAKSITVTKRPDGSFWADVVPWSDSEMEEVCHNMATIHSYS